MNRAQHEISERCASVHCHSHNVDEPADRAYIVCFECGHVYPSALSLWWEYLRQGLRLTWKDLLDPMDPPRELMRDVPWYAKGRPSAVWMLLRSLLRRPSRITFCQHCIHDF